MEFDPDFFSTFHLKKTEGAITVKGHLRISRVMANNDLMAPSKGHHFFKERFLSNRRGRVIGVVDEKEFCFFGDGFRNFRRVGEKAILLTKRQKIRGASRKKGCNTVDRVSRAWD